jgi:hypothetical protein
MRKSTIHQPDIGPGARTLGVRPDVDIPVVKGMVMPATGGLSVAPDTPNHLPSHRRPAAFGGTGKDPIWSLDLDRLERDLTFRQDQSKHGVIEPARPMSITEFQQALADTASKWEEL